MQVQIGLRGVVTTILPALVTWSSAKCSANEVFIGAIPQTLRRNGFGAKKADLDAYPIFSPTIFVTPRKCPRIGNDSRAWNWLPSQELHLSPQRTDV